MGIKMKKIVAAFMTFCCIQIVLLAMYTHDDHQAMGINDNVVICLSKESQDLFREFFKSDSEIKVVEGTPVYPESFLLAVHEINNQSVELAVRIWIFSMIENLVQQGYFYDEAYKAAERCLRDYACEIRVAVLKVLLHLAKKGRIDESILGVVQHCFTDNHQEVRIHALNLFSVLARSRVINTVTTD
jgi:hypothetical protein